MTWLRLDDRFAQHPKFDGWTPAQRWAWVELMSYCARHRTRGKIPRDLSLLPRSVRKPLLDKARKSGWIDEKTDGFFWIHDFQIYNGESVEERVAAYLEKRPEATANEIYREVGGKRDLVLAAISELRTDGSQPVLEGFPNGSQPGSPVVPDPVPDQSPQRFPYAGARAPHPDPIDLTEF